VSDPEVGAPSRRRIGQCPILLCGGALAAIWIKPGSYLDLVWVISRSDPGAHSPRLGLLEHLALQEHLGGTSGTSLRISPPIAPVEPVAREPSLRIWTVSVLGLKLIFETFHFFGLM